VENTRRLGDCEIDLRLFELRRAGEVVPVERRVFDLIAYLLENSDRVVPNEELVRVLWKGRIVSKGSLTVAIAAARKALRDDSAQAQVIITHRGRGYRLQPGERSEGDPIRADGASGSTSFVGREVELAKLSEIFEDASNARSKFVSISGEPGIGKSRLAEEFAAISRTAGALVAVGRCREEEGAPSFWPFVQIAKQLCSEQVDRGLAKMLVSEAPEIAALVPELKFSVDSIPNVLPPANARFRLFDGFSRFLRCAGAAHTLVLILDDIHRADMPSLLLLDFILRDLREAQLLVVATYRPLELESERARVELVSGIARHTPGIAVELEGLGTSEIAKLIRRGTGCTPTPEQTRSVEDLTNGNPFFLSQLLPFLSKEPAKYARVVGALPPTVRDAIGRQIEGFSAEATHVLMSAAVVGREFDAWLVERSIGWSSHQVAAALREACAGRVVTQLEGDGCRWRFSHALVRDVLYQGLEESSRTSLHAAIGEVLDSSQAVRRERLPEIAYHFSEAASVCGPERAIDLACEAARAASDGLAYEAASAHYAQALKIAESFWTNGFDRHCTILLRMGAEQLRSGDREAAKQSFERAAGIADSICEPSLLAEAALGAAPGFFAVEAGVPDEFVVSLLRRALRSLDDGQDEWRALVMARLGAALFWSEDGEECVRLSRRAAGLAGDAGDPGLRLSVMLARWLAEWSPYEVDQRRELAAGAVSLARTMGSKEALAVSLLHRCVGELECGEMGSFDRSAEEFRTLAHELKQPQPLWYAHLLESARALHSGRFARAEEGMQRFFELGRRIGDANAFLSKMAQSLVHAAERGTGAEIVAISEAASRRYPLFIGWRGSRCWGLALTGETQAAMRELDELLVAVKGRLHRRLDWPTTLAVMSESARLLGRADAAGVIRELLLPLKGRILVLGFCVMTWGPVSRYLGLLSEAMGLQEEAEAWYQSAIEESARSEGEPWLARSEAALARVWRRLGRPTKDADALRQRALARASKLGMTRLQREISSS
jgi:DNA-binding winged helix-turn-helix (wHTH) protein/tetratricopeptide (TPR) repeat protein